MKIAELFEDESEPLVVSMLRKLLRAQKLVRINLGKTPRAIYNVEYGKHWDGRPFVEVFHTDDHATPAQDLFVGDDVQHLKLVRLQDGWELQYHS
jgi:hypothetical protein